MLPRYMQPYGKTKPPACAEGLIAISKSDYAALVTLPAFRQDEQTRIFLTLPPILTRTLCKFGLNLRLVTLCACDTLAPNIGFFPHISQTFAIFTPHKNSAHQYKPKSAFSKHFLPAHELFEICIYLIRHILEIVLLLLFALDHLRRSFGQKLRIPEFPPYLVKLTLHLQ